MFADYHTHTVYSHGRGSVRENVEAAINAGLEKIGIADHGYRHLGFGVKYENFDKMRNEIEKLKPEYREIEILLGVEANILDIEGRIDVDEHIRGLVDYVMAGYHFGSMPTHIVRGSINHALNYIKPLNHLSREYNTRALVNAMRRNDIFIISHPGAKASINLEKVAEAAIETSTALEINSSHGHLSLEELLRIKDTGVSFAIGSDAHRPQDVGNFTDALQRVEKAGIAHQQIINSRR